MAYSVLILFAILALLVSANVVLFDFPIGSTSLSHYQCVKRAYDEIVIFMPTSATGIIDSYRQMFINANTAGLKVQLGFFPCRSLSPEQQANELIKKLGQNNVDRVWIYPLDLNTDSCSWKHSTFDSNCIFLQDVLSALKRNGYKTGAAALLDFWKTFFGSELGCPQVAGELLAWIPAATQQDHNPALEPYYKIGGW